MKNASAAENKIQKGEPSTAIDILKIIPKVAVEFWGFARGELPPIESLLNALDTLSRDISASISPTCQEGSLNSHPSTLVAAPHVENLVKVLRDAIEPFQVLFDPVKNGLRLKRYALTKTITVELPLIAKRVRGVFGKSNWFTWPVDDSLVKVFLAFEEFVEKVVDISGIPGKDYWDSFHFSLRNHLDRISSEMPEVVATLGTDAKAALAQRNLNKLNQLLPQLTQNENAEFNLFKLNQYIKTAKTLDAKEEALKVAHDSKEVHAFSEDMQAKLSDTLEKLINKSPADITKKVSSSAFYSQAATVLLFRLISNSAHGAKLLTLLHSFRDRVYKQLANLFENIINKPAAEITQEMDPGILDSQIALLVEIHGKMLNGDQDTIATLVALFVEKYYKKLTDLLEKGVIKQYEQEIHLHYRVVLNDLWGFISEEEKKKHLALYNKMVAVKSTQAVEETKNDLSMEIKIEEPRLISAIEEIKIIEEPKPICVKETEDHLSKESKSSISVRREEFEPICVEEPESQLPKERKSNIPPVTIKDSEPICVKEPESHLSDESKKDPSSVSQRLFSSAAEDYINDCCDFIDDICEELVVRKDFLMNESITLCSFPSPSNALALNKLYVKYDEREILSYYKLESRETAGLSPNSKNPNESNQASKAYENGENKAEANQQVEVKSGTITLSDFGQLSLNPAFMSALKALCMEHDVKRLQSFLNDILKLTAKNTSLSDNDYSDKIERVKEVIVKIKKHKENYRNSLMNNPKWSQGVAFEELKKEGAAAFGELKKNVIKEINTLIDTPLSHYSGIRAVLERIWVNYIHVIIKRLEGWVRDKNTAERDIVIQKLTFENNCHFFSLREQVLKKKLMPVMDAADPTPYQRGDAVSLAPPCSATDHAQRFANRPRC